MIALAATAIALGPQLLHKHLAAISTPVLLCMHDPDPRVRYYALEAFYNVSKVSREGVLVMFTDVFDACCRLSADPGQKELLHSFLPPFLIFHPLPLHKTRASGTQTSSWTAC